MDYYEAQELAKTLGDDWRTIYSERFGYGVTSPILLGPDYPLLGDISTMIWQADGKWWTAQVETEYVDRVRGEEPAAFTLNEWWWRELEPCDYYEPTQPQACECRTEAVGRAFMMRQDKYDKYGQTFMSTDDVMREVYGLDESDKGGKPYVRGAR